ncbi:hypothetical protein QJS10_CPB04g00357 [Acorus calamus]|uniref:Uncharacterized protein n=1 Tax=Acorus calamus TaxID=4465 RepID=A0AAV9F476_ACOCL|nr:hypothetical protein QJS10_CPB04g00357 [Acorus calamus]
MMEIGGPSSAAAIGTATCQDCGNQAKKDCSHRRCRTCCKSRGFDCSTHVKSTWVPASRRRERQAAAATASTSTTSASKKPRISSATATSTSTTHSRSFDTTSSHQDGSTRLPGQVRAEAVFKCVRVTAIDDGEDEYAYQATVRIGGHVFKGFLYDQGRDSGGGDDDDDNNNNNNNNAIIPNLSELHIGGSSVGGGDVYGSSGGTGGGGGLMGGTAYGNPIN